MKISLFILIAISSAVMAQNIDATYKHAYAENVGWLNFKPSQGLGVTVYSDRLEGDLWAENIGWVRLKTSKNMVLNNGLGELSGYAWGENVGWINFNPAVPGDNIDEYRVRIDHSGNFTGWAWGENIGWIHFASTAPIAYKVKTSWITSCRVDLNDLASFSAQWLMVSPYPLYLDSDFIKLPRESRVDFVDFSHLASLWMNYCPYAWPWLD